MARGHFPIHIRNNCLTLSQASPAEEQNLLNLSTFPTTLAPVANKTQIDEQQIERHLSNLYRRIHALETELFELKKVIYMCLFVVASIGALIFLGSIFSYVIVSFLSVVFTEWLPSIVQTSSKFLFDFSPSMTLLRIVFIGLYFVLFCYKRQPSDISLVTIIICSMVVIFNVLILVLYLIMNHFNILFILYGMIMVARYYRVRPPNNEQIRSFFVNLRRMSQPQHWYHSSWFKGIWSAYFSYDSWFGILFHADTQKIFFSFFSKVFFLRIHLFWLILF